LAFFAPTNAQILSHPHTTGPSLIKNEKNALQQLQHGFEDSSSFKNMHPCTPPVVLYPVSDNPALD
jgi:hypothetical protein